jgi:arginine/ornithine N-succinyltransferase beta subunit
LCIVSNRNLAEYRLITSRIENPTEDEITISAADAKMLNVDIGSEIQMLQMRQ